MSKKYALLSQQDFQQDLNGITENAVFPEYLDEVKYQPRTLIDETLETIDPTPNVHTMFIQFNEKFFSEKLLPVQVRWSQRMTTCAGTCSFHPRNRECVIALSAPLLKLRPRKDLVETLLHEMIHAYLFLTNNNRDRDGHGPEFCKHMNRINNIAGTNITIYHNFHDEVKLYQQHWWRCNGPCQNRAPYFGTVRRAMNRAPGPSDFWFQSHQINCGGEFIKIREPDNKIKMKNKNNDPYKSPVQTNTIDRYITSKDSKSSSKPAIKPPSNTNSNGCRCKDKKNNSSAGFAKLGTNANNVYGFGTGGPGAATTQSQLNNVTPKSTPPTAAINFSGVVGGNPTGRSNLLNKYYLSPSKQTNNVREIMDSNSVKCPICNNNFAQELINNHIDVCLENGDNNGASSSKRPKLSTANSDRSNTSANSENSHLCPICQKKFPGDIINSHLDDCLLQRNLMRDTMSKDNQKRNNNNGDKNFNNTNGSTNFHECPICSDFFTEEAIYNHVNECLIDDGSRLDSNDNNNSIVDVTATSEKNKTDRNYINCPTCCQNIRVANYITHVETCLAAEYDRANSNRNNVVILDDIDDIDKPGSSRQINNSNAGKYKCLVCNEMISRSIPLNIHLDYCVSITYSDTSISNSSVTNKMPTININDDNDSEEEEEDKHLCPICMKMIVEKLMAKHVDDCVKSIN